MFDFRRACVDSRRPGPSIVARTSDSGAEKPFIGLSGSIGGLLFENLSALGTPLHGPSMDAPDPPPRAADWRADLARYSGLGLTFGVTVTLFALGGWWLDGRLGSSPWGLLVGTGLGFAGGLISMVKKLPPPGGGR